MAKKKSKKAKKARGRRGMDPERILDQIGKKAAKADEKKASERGLDRRLYLASIGVPIEKRGTNFAGRENERWKKWKKERKWFGFDSRETYSLDLTFAHWAYERLRAYRDEASGVVDLARCPVTFGGRETTLRAALDELIERFEEIVLDDGADDVEDARRLVAATKLFADALPCLRW